MAEQNESNTAAPASPRPILDGSVFEAAAAQLAETGLFRDKDGLDRGMLQTIVADMALTSQGIDFISHVKPTEILVSRVWPGYRIIDLTGKNVDEAIGLTLGEELQTSASLDVFRRTISSPQYTQAIVFKLLPRPDQTVMRGVYKMSERIIRETVSDTLSVVPSMPTSVIAAIAHVMIRVFDSLDLVLPQKGDRKLVRTASSFAIGMDELRRIVITESMRDIFSEARISEASRALDAKGATPVVIAEAISRMLRTSSQMIPEVRLRIEQLDVAMGLVLRYLTQPKSLTTTVQASASLQALASYANFLVEALLVENVVRDVDLPVGSNQDLRDACDRVITIIRSTPSIEAIPLSTYVDHFGILPSSGQTCLYKGAVVYLALTQTSKMEIGDMVPGSGAVEIAALDPMTAPAGGIASELNSRVLSIPAMRGLAELVADELSMLDLPFGGPPILRTIGVPESDLLYLAMGKADIVSYMATTQGPRLVYGVNVEEQWMSQVGAATPGMAFFDHPGAVIVYKTGPTPKEPTPVPARPQSFGLSAMLDSVYLAAEPHLCMKVEETFNFAIPFANPYVKGGKSTLDMRLVPLGFLVGWEIDRVPDRGGSRYVAILEPGVDRDLEIEFTLAAAYASAENEVLRDKGKSWVIETLAPIMKHPVIQRIAARALHAATVAGGIDARRLRPQWKDVTTRAYYITLMGILARYCKISTTLAAKMISVAPTQGISVQAAIALADTPAMLDASVLRDNK